jgi:hypothetical protein
MLSVSSGVHRYTGEDALPQNPRKYWPPNGVNIPVSRVYVTPTLGIVGGTYYGLIPPPKSHRMCRFTMTLTRQEISRHNSRQSCWVVIHGAVYDVTGEVLSSVECPKLTL